MSSALHSTPGNRGTAEPPEPGTTGTAQVIAGRGELAQVIGHEFGQVEGVALPRWPSPR